MSFQLGDTGSDQACETPGDLQLSERGIPNNSIWKLGVEMVLLV